MAITDKDKLDILWKKIIYGVSETSVAGKAATEENIPSPATVYNNHVWSQSDLIPIPADQSSVVEFVDIKLVADPSVPTRQTWFAPANPNAPVSVANRLTDFISFTTDPGYEIKIYSKSDKSERLLPGASGREWVFDYSSGILYFFNELPGSITELYLTGYRYVGAKGSSSGGSGNGSGSVSLVPVTFKYITNINSFDTKHFTLPTGSEFFLTDLSVDLPVTVESHRTAYRDEVPQYKFVATNTHLVDDGSYVSGGVRYYGPRHVLLMNTSHPSSGVSYWTVSSEQYAGKLTVTVKTLRFGNPPSDLETIIDDSNSSNDINDDNNDGNNGGDDIGGEI